MSEMVVDRHSETQELTLLPRRSLRRVEDPEPRRRDRTVYLVAAAAAVLSAVVCGRLAMAHELLGYHDAYSHLEISRRIVTSQTTGIAQLGTVWLPLPHILQAMFAWNSTLYTTGLAGALVSMACFVVATTYVYRIVRELCDGRQWPAIVGAAVFMTNADLLFQQATPMDELPFYVFTLAAVYGLVRWANTNRPTHLLSAAVANMPAMLCRYESWSLAAVFTVCVIVMARRLGHSWRDVRGLAMVWISFGGAIAALGWLAYNWMVTGSALTFIDGPASSLAQMNQRNADTTQHNTDVEVGSWTKSAHAYAETVAANLGLVIIGLALVGLVLFVMREWRTARALPVLGLLTVLPFYVYSLESGQVPIAIPPVNPGLLNVRYGLFALLPAALIIGYLAGRLPTRAAMPVAVLSITALLGMSVWSFTANQVVLNQESVGEEVSQSLQIQAGDYIQHQTTGTILINLVGNERVAYSNLDRVVYEGTKDRHGNVWSRALSNPATVGAQVIVMRDSVAHGADEVYSALHDWPGLSAYHLGFRNSDYTVYVLGAGKG